MVGRSPFLGWSASNYNLFYSPGIWLQKILIGKISLNVVKEVIEVDELDKGNMWKTTFSGRQPSMEDNLQGKLFFGGR